MAAFGGGTEGGHCVELIQWTRMKKGIRVPCATCGKPRYVFPYIAKRGRRTFCSRRCAGFKTGDPKPPKANRFRSGRAHPNWKGGTFVSPQGYVMLNVAGRIVKRSRYRMEQHLGRRLRSSEIVHHKDGDKTNDRLRNLEMTTRAEHCREHAPRQFHRSA